MKIAIIAPTEIPARRANTLQVMKMTQALQSSGHQIRLAAPQTRSTAIPGWEELARHYGLQHSFPIDWLKANPRFRRYDFSLRAVAWARRWQAELIYTRLPQAAALASFLGSPTILETHDLPQGSLGPWMFHKFLRGKGARRLVVITHALAQDLSQKMGAPTTPPFTVIAPDGVDLERYADLPTPTAARQRLNQSNVLNLPSSTAKGRRLPEETFTAGYTGHLYPGRGSDLLLALAQRLPETCFLIVGGEPQDVAHLQARAASLHIDNLYLTGFVPNAELPLYQAACDVLLMPYQEQVAASSGGDIARYLSPLKLFEYLACQRPIISSDLPVLREILNENNAILLPLVAKTATNEIETWAEALMLLKSQPETRARLAAQARQDASLYTWESRAAHILQGL
jgi:glycosyltransferase involved in cell wall biosynthesis